MPAQHLFRRWSFNAFRAVPGTETSIEAKFAHVLFIVNAEEER
jgi:hypothetical protein